MKISVITPCYNPGRFLKPMLESVAANEELVYKHIVMDGGSNDGSVEVMKEWAADHPWFEYVSEPDKGQADACRKALERVETEYFLWLNADDVILPDALKNLTSVVDQNSKMPPTIVYGDYKRIDGEGKVFAERRQPSYSYWDCLHGYIFVQNAAAIFNTKALRDAGGFDPSLRFVMDYDIILKLGKIGPVKHVKHFCGAFRVHETSKTTTIDDVCQRETQELRTRYGVSENALARKLSFYFAKFRVVIRMLLQGCMKGRLY